LIQPPHAQHSRAEGAVGDVLRNRRLILWRHLLLYLCTNTFDYAGYIINFSGVCCGGPGDVCKLGLTVKPLGQDVCGQDASTSNRPELVPWGR
jgi:hypothetical protein